MPHNAPNRRVSQSRDKLDHVANEVHRPEGGQIAVVVRIPADSATVPALVWCDHVIAGRS